jgi:threonine dehydratase
MRLKPAVSAKRAIAACCADDRIFDIVRRTVDEIVFVDGKEMFAAAPLAMVRDGEAADLSVAAALAALQTGWVRLATGSAPAPSSVAPARGGG